MNVEEEKINLGFNRVILSDDYTGCSLFSLIVMNLRHLSLLSEDAKERQIIASLAQQQCDDDAMWLVKCQQLWAMIYVNALKNDGTTVSCDEAWKFINTVDSIKPKCLQQFTDKKRVQHTTPYCIKALNYLLSEENLVSYCYSTCQNNCIINMPGFDNDKPNIIPFEYNGLFEWNPTNTGVTISIQSAIDEAISTLSKSQFDNVDDPPETCEDCESPMVVYDIYFGRNEYPAKIWLSLGFFTNEADGSSSARSICSVDASIGGMKYKAICRVEFLSHHISLHQK